MKLESLTFFFLFSLVSISLHGQYIPVVAEGKYWIYLYHHDEDHPSPVSGHAIKMEGDTTISSMTYKKVYSHNLKGGHHCQFPPCFEFDLPYQSLGKHLVAFIREDTVSKKVFNLPVSRNDYYCDTIEHLILDYSLGIGDTLHDCLYEFIGAFPDYPLSSLGIVDSVQVTSRFGKNRNTIFTTGIPLYGGLGFYWQVLLLEGVGLENYGIFHERLTYLVDFCDGGVEACDLLTSNATIESEKEVIVLPNPTQGPFSVSISEELLNATYTIVNSIGQVTQSFKLTELNFAGQLPSPGIYIWRIEKEGRFISTGKLVCN